MNEIQSENIASNFKMSGSGMEDKNKINELNNDINHLLIKNNGTRRFYRK